MRTKISHIFFGLLVFLLTVQCSAPYRLFETVAATRTPTTGVFTQTPTGVQRAAPTSTPLPTLPAKMQATTPAAAVLPAATLTVSQPADIGASCAYHPAVAQGLGETSPEQWIEWIAMLSGDLPVTIAGEETRIETRYSPAMFDGQANARAFEWLHETLLQWYPAEQIEAQPFDVHYEDRAHTWKNLVLTLPGTVDPDTIVILSAHLDSTSNTPQTYAPGAEDNGSGSATLIEAARLFRETSFERTLKIIWFTGEEQGLLGSQAFVATLDPKQIAGVVNLDMFGYDSDDDRCFELHVGKLPASDAVGACVVESITAYDLDLTYDYLREGAIDRSDHGSFWAAGVGAVEFLHDLLENNQPNGCRSRDPNPHYHTTQDVVANINPQTGFAIAQAGIAAAAGLARPVGRAGR